jgi:hypothetical protein
MEQCPHFRSDAPPPAPTTSEPPAGKGTAFIYSALQTGGARLEGTLGEYLERELLVTGTANVYRYGATVDDLEVVESDVSYTTRTVVRRP